MLSQFDSTTIRETVVIAAVSNYTADGLNDFQTRLKVVRIVSVHSAVV